MYLEVLGIPQLTSANENYSLAPKRPLLLLSYLAYRQEWVTRDEILTLFWPEKSERDARHSLRQLLYRAKKEMFGELLLVTKDKLSANVSSDVQAFQAALEKSDWTKQQRCGDTTNATNTRKATVGYADEAYWTDGRGNGPTIRNAVILQFGVALNVGTIDISSILERIKRGDIGKKYHKNDGEEWENKKNKLPPEKKKYYTEYHVPTFYSGKSIKPGSQRLVIGESGEVYWTGTHYETFTLVFGSSNEW